MMDIKSQLVHEKGKLLKQISESAQRGNSQEILIASERLNKVESLIDRHQRLLRDVDKLSAPQSQSPPSVEAPAESDVMQDMGADGLDTAGRGIGRTIRLDFLKKANKEGFHLAHIRGSIYENKSGRKIGIAFAQERKPNRWFLGLPRKRFLAPVLLCKTSTGETIEICIPENFFSEYSGQMSQSAGQIKFNIVRRGHDYWMLVPGTDGVNVSKFIGNYSALE